MVTKNADDDKAWVWESEIDSSSYSIREATDADGPPARGTKTVSYTHLTLPTIYSV